MHPKDGPFVSAKGIYLAGSIAIAMSLAGNVADIAIGSAFPGGLGLLRLAREKEAA